MKKSEEFDDIRTAPVEYDPELEKYRGKVLFPEKLALANEHLKNVKLPESLLSKKRVSD